MAEDDEGGGNGGANGGATREDSVTSDSSSDSSSSRSRSNAKDIDHDDEGGTDGGGVESDGELTPDYLDGVETISNSDNANAVDDGGGVLDAGSPVSPTVN